MLHPYKSSHATNHGIKETRFLKTAKPVENVDTVRLRVSQEVSGDIVTLLDLEEPSR